MATRKTKTPKDCLAEWLGDRPRKTRCEWVIDIDRLVEWQEPEVVDDAGLRWRRVVYSGDDVAFRSYLRTVAPQAAKDGAPLLFVVTRGSDNAGPIDISHIADVLSMAEGEPLDLSIVAYFRRIFPKVSPPQDTLRRYKTEFIDCLEGIGQAYEQFKQRWGEPDTWGRAQFLTLLFMAKHPEFHLYEVFCDDDTVDAYLGHACALIMRPAVADFEMPLLWELIRESRQTAQVPLDEVKAWLGCDPGDCAVYLVSRDFAERLDLQNPAAQLTGTSAVALAPHQLEARAANVIRSLKANPNIWENVNRRAEEFLQGRTLKRLCDLAKDAAPEGMLNAAQDSPVLMREILEILLRQFFENPNLGSISWVSKLTDMDIMRDTTGSPTREKVSALAHCATAIEAVERQIAAPVPTTSTAEDLLRWYCEERVYFLELDASDIYHRLEAGAGSDVLRLGDQYVHSQGNGLLARVRNYLDSIDRMLADFVRPDPRKFALRPRSAMRIISAKLTELRSGARQGRAWILVFDGMRYDTWQRVVRPLLAEHFEFEHNGDEAYFAVLPTRTWEARRALLSGQFADQWKTYDGKPTKDERLLVARNLGLTKAESQRIRFIADAETTEARRKMGFKDSDAPKYNVLIYPVSDDLGHFHGDTLPTLNASIRQSMVGDKEGNLRGIVDDLLRRIGPDDVVLVTSDHGFMELLPWQKVEVTRLEAQKAGNVVEDVVQYRYLTNFDAKNAKETVRVDWDSSNGFVLAVGGAWFSREGGKPARYAHGGLSMVEMVVPGVLMKRISQKLIRLEIVDLPEAVDIREDEQSVLTWSIKNTGNTMSEYEITVRSNLGDTLLSESGTLDARKAKGFRTKIVGSYAEDSAGRVLEHKTLMSITILLRHKDLNGQMREPTGGRESVKVVVTPKPSKIGTDALSGFDNV